MLRIQRSPFLAMLLASLVFLFIWGQAGFAPYHYDDFITPLQDPASQSLSSWMTHFFHTLRPLTKLTYALESSLGLTEAPMRRAVSTLIGLFTLNFFILLLQKKSLNWPIALILSLIWALHPVHAESLISLAGRSTLLATLFIILSLYQENARFRILFAILAVLAKEVALLYLLYLLFQELKKSSSKKAGLIAISLLPLLFFIFNHRLQLLIRYSWKEVPYITHWWDGFAGISAGLVYFFLPSKVSLELEFPWTISALWFFVSFLLVMIVLWVYKRTRAEALLLWLCLILPTQSLLPKLDALSLRSLSFASLALPLIFLSLMPARWWSKSLFFLIPFLLLTAASSFELARVYRDPVKLWRDASEKTKKKTRPLVNLSYFLVRENNYPEAKSVLEEALRRDPRNVEVRERLRALTYLMESFNR